MDAPKDVTLDSYFADSITVNPDLPPTVLIAEAARKIPAAFAYQNEKYAMALRGSMTADLGVKNIEARLRIEKREQLVMVNGKATESMVDSEVQRDPSFQNAKVVAIEAEVQAVLLKGRMEAIRMTRDMIMQLGAQARAELMGDPQIREFAQGARASK
jgi:hypothetical protein